MRVEGRLCYGLSSPFPPITCVPPHHKLRRRTSGSAGGSGAEVPTPSAQDATFLAELEQTMADLDSSDNGGDVAGEDTPRSDEPKKGE